MRRYFLLSVFIFTFFGCQRQVGQFNCKTTILEIDPVKSKVLSLKKVKTDNLTESYITGIVLGRGTYSQLKPDTLPFEYINLVDKATGQTFSQPSDVNGKFKFSLSGSNYDLRIARYGSNRLKIVDIDLNSGESIELQFLLGIGKDSTIYEMTSNDELKLVY